MRELWSDIELLLGLRLDVSDVDVVQMALRTIVVYAFTLAVIRIGSRRFLGRSAALDVIVGIMLGSIMSRAINGSAPFVPTLGAGAVLIGLHWLLTVLAFHVDAVGPLVKGNEIALVEEGRMDEAAMRRGGITRRDLDEALRHNGQSPDLSRVEAAWLERDGGISIIPRRTVKVVDIAVRDGVQVVRVELS